MSDIPPPKFRVGQQVCDKMLIRYPGIPEFRTAKKSDPAMFPSTLGEHVYWLEGIDGFYREGDLADEDEIIGWAKSLIYEIEGPHANRW